MIDITQISTEKAVRRVWLEHVYDKSATDQAVALWRQVMDVFEM